MTKYIFSQAVKDKSAETVASFIYEKIVLEHGCPAVLLSDNGKEYKNKVVEEICRKLMINKKYSTPYRPQTNGLAERTNRTILAILAKNAYKDKDNWDNYVELVRFNYNIRYQENLNCSPFELLYGRKPLLPYTLKTTDKEETTIERMERIRKQQNEIMEGRRNTQQKLSRPLNEKDKIKIGEIVHYKNLNKENKLDTKWIGPFIVEHADNVGSYVISDTNKK